MKNSLLKSIRFNMDDESDRNLYNWMSHLPHNAFTERTKKFWLNEMNRVPMGYRMGEGEHEILIDEDEMKIVRLIFEIRNTTKLNPDELETILNEFNLLQRGVKLERPIEEIRSDVFARIEEMINSRNT
ncbi:hypothetical protein D3C73_1116740 [compost metagenome]